MLGVFRVFILWGFIALVGTSGLQAVVAQDLIEIYTQARFKHLAEQYLKAYGTGLVIKPPTHIAHPTDTLRPLR